MEKEQFVEEMLENVRSIAPSQVLNTRINLQNNTYALCPFHADTKIGSFVNTDARKIWKCFSCDVGGDAIKFISLFDEIDYLAAAFKVALEFKLITEEEYDVYFTRKRYKAEDVLKLQRKYERMDFRKAEYNIADNTILDQVFRLFIAQTKLSDEHKEHLNGERGLSDEEIEKGMYFTFPTRQIMRSFLKEMINHFGSEKVLETVPGFYYSPTEMKWAFPKASGIGIGIQNAAGQVVGIQIRSDSKKAHRSRYFWFSSAFAMQDDRYEYGTPAGSPIDVVIPDVITNPSVVITEGRFKSQIVAKETGSIVLSVQGVSSWKGIAKQLEQLPGSELVKNAYKGKEFYVYTVLVAFDADMSTNPQVFEQLRNMTNALEAKRYPTYYLYWNEAMGKGIDDIILAGARDSIGRFDKRKWDRAYDAMIEMILERESIKKDQIKKLAKHKFHQYFLRGMSVLEPLKPGAIGELHEEWQLYVS